MIEHRLIERIIPVARREAQRIRESHTTDPALIDTITDFIRTYADRTHHGKEEDILFRVLSTKPLANDERRIMSELVEEHATGRKLTKALVAANSRLKSGDASALQDMADALDKLVEFYPKHIEKEDRVFFPAATNHLSHDEQQAMLAEFWEFDRKMIHEKYKAVVEALSA